MRESQLVRRFLIETFLVIPDNLEERRWLVDRVRENKKKCLLWDYDPGDEIAKRPYFMNHPCYEWWVSCPEIDVTLECYAESAVQAIGRASTITNTDDAA